MRPASIILKEHQLKKTDCRRQVLEVLIAQDKALSHADLEKELHDDFDRVTLYRTLKTFQEKGLIHKVLDDEGITKYATCVDCSTEEHHHEHVHFKCEDCGTTVCLDDIEIPALSLPAGFKPFERNLLITGTCNVCSKNH